MQHKPHGPVIPVLDALRILREKLGNDHQAMGAITEAYNRAARLLPPPTPPTFNRAEWAVLEAIHTSDPKTDRRHGQETSLPGPARTDTIKTAYEIASRHWPREESGHVSKSKIEDTLMQLSDRGCVSLTGRTGNPPLTMKKNTQMYCQLTDAGRERLAALIRLGVESDQLPQEMRQAEPAVTEQPTPLMDPATERDPLLALPPAGAVGSLGHYPTPSRM